MLKQNIRYRKLNELIDVHVPVRAITECLIHVHFISHSPDDLIHCIYTLREYIYAAVESKFGERECTNEQG